MDLQQKDSRTSPIDPVSQILSSPCFPLDSSLDAELSLHHSMDEAWGNASSFTTGKDSFMFTTSFDPTATAHYQSGSASSTPTELGALPTQPPATTTDTGAPTVRLQRPSFDSSSIIKTTTEEGTISPTGTGGTMTPVDEFGSLNLNLQRRSFSHAADAGTLLDGGIEGYLDQLLPVASSGGVRASSAPNSPFTQGPSALNLDLNVINPTPNRNGCSAPGSPTYLQTSPWPGDETPISPISPSSSPPLSSSALFNGMFDPPTTTTPPQPWPGSTPTSRSGTSTPFQSMYPMDPFSQIDQVSSLQQQQQQQQQQQPHRRSAHNEVEKKYRNNINDRIAELKEAVPALRHARVKRDQAPAAAGDDDHGDDDDDANDPVIMDGVIIATKLNKATILQKATEYVYHLQHTTQELKQDIDVLLSTIETQSSRGQEIVSQYRRHVAQREEMQKQRLVCSEKIKRLKKSDPHHPHHHFHLQLKGQDRTVDRQQPFWFPQHQQRGMDGNAF